MKALAASVQADREGRGGTVRHRPRTIRIRFFYTRYAHFGRYAGLRQFVGHPDPATFASTLTPVADGDGDLHLPSPSINRLVRRTVSRASMPWYNLSDFVAEAKAARHYLMNDVDIVQFIDGEHGGHFTGRLARLRPGCRVKTVAAFHQPPEILRDVVDPSVLRRFDAVVAVSPTQEPFLRLHVPAERLRTLLHGVDTEFFRPPSDRRGAGRFRCITGGNWLRDWATFKAVAQRVGARRPDIEFHVVGQPDIPLDGLPSVHLHQAITDEALRSLYQRAHVLFLPLLQATANNTLLEAMACGLAVVGTSLDSVTAYVAGTGLLLERGDVAGFTATILMLADEPVQCRALGIAARGRAEQLSWRRVARQWEQLYVDLVRRS